MASLDHYWYVLFMSCVLILLMHWVEKAWVFFLTGFATILLLTYSIASAVPPLDICYHNDCDLNQSCRWNGLHGKYLRLYHLSSISICQTRTARWPSRLSTSVKIIFTVGWQINYSHSFHSPCYCSNKYLRLVPLRELSSRFDVGGPDSDLAAFGW